MSFEFVIPVSKDDLLQKSNVNEYVVDEILSLRLIPGSVHGKLNCVTIMDICVF